MPPTEERQLQRLTGDAKRKVVRRGTAGEYRAVVLYLKDGTSLILQRRGGNPFDDATTRGLAGHRVCVKGFRIGNTFRYVEAEVVDN